MPLENFNLNMITPDAGNESDPELKRLNDELWKLKPLIDEAISKQNLPLAEEIFAQIEEAKKRLDEYKESLNRNELKEIEKHLIDTTQKPKIPIWANKGVPIDEHNVSLGTIEWNKEKYKDSLYMVPEQIFGNIKGEEIIQKLKDEGYSLLNSTVLDYLMEHQGQIPEEWKKLQKEHPIHIYFWGTIFFDSKNERYVQFIYWHENEWNVGKDWLNFNWVNSDLALIQAK